ASSCWGISYVGAKPVFVDIEPDTWCLSPEAIVRAITPRTKGIVVVHIFGQPARMDEPARPRRARSDPRHAVSCPC
ncbi:MAG: hypothetical protein DYG90_12575, partial [Chloroflexi bacterium CFX6]|nr:hypothetical protein [Chloroflexi bacterium CFX6]